MPTLNTLQVQVGVSHDLPALSPCVSLLSCQDRSHTRSMLAMSSALGAPSSQTEASAASSALQVGESWLELHLERTGAWWARRVLGPQCSPPGSPGSL